MANRLLRTKLFLPPVPPNHVFRPRLVKRLNDGVGRGLTLIAAPAGSGKTTLLSEWHESAGTNPWPVAWISLDRDDNDPTRFLAYCIAALQTVEPKLGATAQTILETPQGPPLQAALVALVNDLTTVSTTFVVVLDDYEVIEAQGVHDIVTWLLDNRPQQMRLVIASRTDPPLPLARLRVRGHLTELRATDLRFTVEETATFLIQLLGSNISNEHITALNAHTEGWIAGLQLAALSLKGRDDAEEFVGSFRGDDRYVLDYLLSEVLQRQPKHIQEFLLDTSVLTRLNGPLCDAVTGRTDSQEILEFLDQGNLFIVPLDNHRRWYRYHHLFAEAVRYRLDRTHPNRLTELSKRAGAWYEQHGFVHDAIHFALYANDFESAGRLMTSSGQSMLGSGQVRTVLGWLDRLPDEFMLRRPGLCILHAAALTFTDQLERAGERVTLAESAIEPELYQDQAATYLGQVAVIKAMLARIPGNLNDCVAFARQALKLLPESDRFWRGPAAVYAGIEFRLSGDVTQVSEEQAHAAIQVAQASNNRIAALSAMTNLARLQIVQGKLRQAAATYQQLWHWASGVNELWLLAGSPAYHFGMGELHLEWNELNTAEHHFSQGMEVNGWVIDAEVTTAGYVGLAALRQAQGDLHGALETIDTFMLLAQQRHFAPRYVAWGAATQSHLWVLQGKLSAAQQWAQALDVNPEGDIDYGRRHEYLALARLFMAQRRWIDATALLDRLAAHAADGGQMWILTEILVLKTLVLQSRGLREQAMSILDRALSIAEPAGCIRTFVNEGPSMLDLLRRAVSLGIQRVYATELIAVFCELESAAATGSHERPTAASISARELEVLRLLAEEKSGPEIAEQLVLSVSTVRTHVKNIYRKLEVHTRDQAVIRAKALTLL